MPCSGWMKVRATYRFLMSASVYGIPEAFEKPIAAGVPPSATPMTRSAVRRRLVREPLAHPDARAVDLDAADPRVGAREVHVLEDAERAPSRRDALRRVQTLLVDPDDLARLHVTDRVGADEVERARLGRDHPVVADATERQRPEAERVAERDERAVDESGDRVGALEPLHRARHRLRERRLVACDERRDHLGVETGLELHAVGDQLGTQLLDVDEVPVVTERDRPRAAVVDERLRVRPLVRSRRRVARVADRDLARKRLELLLVEHVGDEAHLAEHGEMATVRDRDPRRLLAAVLKREQPEVRETRDVPLLGADAEDSTHQSVLSHGAAQAIERHSQEGTAARLADPAERHAQLARNSLDLVDAIGGARDHCPTADLSEQLDRVVTEIERGARAGEDGRFGEAHREAALRRVVDERRGRSGAPEERDEARLRLEVERRRSAAHLAEARLVLGARERDRRGEGREQRRLPRAIPSARGGRPRRAPPRRRPASDGWRVRSSRCRGTRSPRRRVRRAPRRLQRSRRWPTRAPIRSRPSPDSRS